MYLCIFAVAPRRGAWIEITDDNIAGTCHDLVAPRRGAWIEIEPVRPLMLILNVAPRRGAWIEITP